MTILDIVTTARGKLANLSFADTCARFVERHASVTGWRKVDLFSPEKRKAVSRTETVELDQPFPSLFKVLQAEFGLSAESAIKAVDLLSSVDARFSVREATREFPDGNKRPTRTLMIPTASEPLDGDQIMDILGLLETE